MNTLHLSSEFLEPGSSNNFECELARPIYGLQRIKIKKCFLYEKWDSLENELNFWFHDDQSPPVMQNVIIPPNQYTLPQLLTAIQNAIMAAEFGMSPVVWLVTLLPSGHINFARNGAINFGSLNLSFLETDIQAARSIGFEKEWYAVGGFTANIDSPFKARLLNLFPIYYIAFKEIETSDQVNIQMENPLMYNIMTWTHAVTHVDGDEKDYKWTEQPLMDHWIEIENSDNITNLTVTFLGAVGGHFFELELKDSPWYLELEYQTKDSIERGQKSLNYFY